ncbi:hypothetical protein CEXT_595461 [Caerostris extrusa]|uniref:Uncharacterized protein n=1 Tax=Caerostris extrusa TaxID=172846 RepID=A0AAV4XZV9_CAEEX|nr:hypothetical protein CEXT_595461 [Caerostris extrusa]
MSLCALNPWPIHWIYGNALFTTHSKHTRDFSNCGFWKIRIHKQRLEHSRTTVAVLSAIRMQIPPRLKCPIVHDYRRTKAFDTPSPSTPACQPPTGMKRIRQWTVFTKGIFNKISNSIVQI